MVKLLNHMLDQVQIETILELEKDNLLGDANANKDEKIDENELIQWFK
jgi:hypothetical protein